MLVMGGGGLGAFALRCSSGLDGPAIRNANRGDSRESIRRPKKLFSSRLSDSRESPQTRDKLFFEWPKTRFANKKINGVQFGNPETIPENVNESGDSRESAMARFARIGPSKSSGDGPTVTPQLHKQKCTGSRKL